MRSSASITQVLRYSVSLYERLEAETGLATGWKMTGCLRLATNAERMTEFRRLATTARSFGMEMHLISPAEVAAMWPLMDVSDLVGASFLPTDGQASPSDITQSLAKGARTHGARFFEGVRVAGFGFENGRIVRVETDSGAIACDNDSELRRPMGASDRRARGRQRAAAADEASICRDPADSRPRARRADAPRSRSRHVFQGRGRRPRDGRL